MAQDFGQELWIVLGAVLALLLIILVGLTVWTIIKTGLKKIWDRTFVDHFLAGRSLNGLVFGGSLVASMFSGTSFLGVPAEAYSTGFSAWRWLGTSTFIIIVYLSYAPRLHWLSCVRGYDSIGAYTRDRFGIQVQYRDALHWAVTCVQIVPSFVFLATQFRLFGDTLYMLAGGDVDRWVFTLSTAVVLGFFEVVVGLQLVAVTDAFQGAVIAFGAMFILIFMDTQFHGLTTMVGNLQTTNPSLLEVPLHSDLLNWVELWVGWGLQRALLVDFPQRAMAAKSQDAMRLGFDIVIFAPFLVQVPLVFFGIICRANHPTMFNADDVFPQVVLDIFEYNVFGRVMSSIMMSAALFAMMSTMDSLIIGLTHIVTLDVLRPILEVIEVREIAELAKDPAAEGLTAPNTASGGSYAAHGSTTPQSGAYNHSPRSGATSQGRSHTTPEADAKVPTTSTASRRVGEERPFLVFGSRFSVAVVLGITLAIAESNHTDLPFLEKFQSVLIAQSFPTLVLSLYWRGLQKWSCTAGLVLGAATGVTLVGNNIEGGTLISLGVNLVVTFASTCTFTRLAAPRDADHARALEYIFWRHEPPTLCEEAGHAPPPYREPIKSDWGCMVLLLVIPWFGLPFWRSEGTEDYYLSGSPLWAVTLILVLLAAHVLMALIVTLNWRERPPPADADHPVAASPIGAADIAGEQAVYGHHAGGLEELQILRAELNELRSELTKLGSTNVALVREAVREEVSALFA